MDRAEFARRTMRRITIASNLANLAGVAVVAAFLFVLIPSGVGRTDLAQIGLNIGATVLFLAIAFVVGIAVPERRSAKITAWLSSGREPTQEDRDRVLSAPTFGFLFSLSIWIVGALVFAAINLPRSPAGAITIGLTILFGGATTASLTGLTVERLMQPVTQIVLASGQPPRPRRGVARRITLAWLLGTGVPVGGTLGVIVGVLSGSLEITDQALVAALLLLVVALTIGLRMIVLNARAVSKPIAEMRAALSRVEQGDFDARMTVSDGSEVGLLQAGFNRMAAGLAERERIREAFGTYVDPDIAERVLEEGTMLAGEEVDVTVMFLDVRGFTGFVEREAPDEVVRTLNQLFELIVPIIHRHGGHVNKFLGDGLLAVFGAPRRDERHADEALDAAVEVARAVRDELGERLEIGIGLNSGRVVAGNVGGAGRLEFSVVGDPVNVAARIESTTRATGDTILISATTRERLRQEPPDLEERPPQPVKGRAEPVSICAVRV